jgi:transposase
MAKYTDKQKLEAVEAYRRGSGGLLATAQAHGVGIDSLRKWVAAYSAHGAAGVVTKKRGSNYDLEFKLEVLRRMNEEGISSRQAAALFNIRRLNKVAEWSRLYAVHGVAALQPGWKEEPPMTKTPRRRNDVDALPDEQRSREELLRDLQQLRLENAYLKKVQALVRIKKRSVPAKGR